MENVPKQCQFEAMLNTLGSKDFLSRFTFSFDGLKKAKSTVTRRGHIQLFLYLVNINLTRGNVIIWR